MGRRRCRDFCPSLPGIDWDRPGCECLSFRFPSLSKVHGVTPSRLYTRVLTHRCASTLPPHWQGSAAH
eukprot:3621895-Rhodomonas_salina.1